MSTRPLPPDTWKLAPDHPAREGVMRMLSDPEPRAAIVIETPGDAQRSWLDLTGPDSRTMNVRKAWALAPYVGRPFRYLWFVGVLEGRPVASGSARIVYLPEPMCEVLRG